MALLTRALGLSLLLALLGSVCVQRVDTHPIGDRELAACIRYLHGRALDQAETACSICLRYLPDKPECLNGLGLIAYYRGDDAKAADYYKRAIRRDNDFAEARSNLGVLELEAHNYSKAIRLFRSAVEIDPAYQDGQYNLGWALLSSAQEEHTRQLRRPASDRSYGALLELYRQAEVEYRVLMELHPSDPRSYRDLGFIESRRADLASTGEAAARHVARARELYGHCLVLDAQSVECNGNLGHLLLGIGRCDEALPFLAACLAVDAASPSCLDDMRAASACAAAASAATE